jgi:predicted membrane protein
VFWHIIMACYTFVLLLLGVIWIVYIYRVLREKDGELKAGSKKAVSARSTERVPTETALNETPMHTT